MVNALFFIEVVDTRTRKLLTLKDPLGGINQKKNDKFEFFVVGKTTRGLLLIARVDIFILLGLQGMVLTVLSAKIARGIIEKYGAVKKLNLSANGMDRFPVLLKS